MNDALDELLEPLAEEGADGPSIEDQIAALEEKLRDPETGLLPPELAARDAAQADTLRVLDAIAELAAEGRLKL